MYNPFSLEGKTVLVTGASSGIGRATAIECSKIGATLAITGRNADRLHETFDALEGSGHQQFIADLCNTEDIENLVNSLDKLDGVVSNAGIALIEPIPFYKEKELESVFRINTFSMILLTKFLVKKKKLNRHASIVYTASIGNVYTGGVGNGIYGASKCAVDGFMRTAALELASKGIRCNTVNPGMVETEMMTSTDIISAEQFAEDMKRYPLGRYGKPEDVAWAIIYLLSDASSWVTGISLRLDGGFCL